MGVSGCILDEIFESEMYFDINGKIMVVTKSVDDGRPMTNGTVIIG